MKHLFFLLFSFICLAISITSCQDDDEFEQPSMTRYTFETRATFTYPTVTQIMKDSLIAAEMKAAWEKTLEIATDSSRQEIGFTIYYNQKTKALYIGEWVYGPKIRGCEDTAAEISLKITNNIEACAFFHTHTPLYYCPASTSRSTGPSIVDKASSLAKTLPGLLYDYGTSTIHGSNGHGSGLNAPPKIYTFGVKQRKEFSFDN